MRLSVKKITVFLLFTFYVTRLLSQSQSQKIEDLIMSHVNSPEPFNGSVLVAHKDKVVYEGAFGVSAFNSEVKNTIESKYFIGSLTKQITTVAILQLIEKGKLNFDDKLSSWFPEIQNSDQIQIHHLLVHQSGLARDSHQKYEDITTFYERALSVKDDTLRFQPGEQEAYSNVGFYALTYILEKVSGLKYERYFAKHIFKPAKMKNTGVKKKQDGEIESLTTGMGMGPDSFGVNDLADAREFYGYSFGGGGSLYSTVGDWYKFFIALKNGKLLSLDMVEKMKLRWPVTGKSRERFYHSYGWEMFNVEAGRIIGFTGRIYGYVSMIRYYEKYDVLVIIFCNNEFSDRYHIPSGIRKIIVGEDYEKNKGKVIKEVSLSEGIKKYVGVYDFPEEKTNVKIKLINNKITLESHGDKPIYLIPTNENTFISKYIPLAIKFKEDKETGAIKLEWNFNNEMVFELSRVAK